MIELNDLNVQYHQLNNPTLKNLNLSIKNGEKVLIVGPSGSGKSTFGKVLNGLIPNSQMAHISGEGRVEQMNLGKSSIFELSRAIGTIMQDQDAQFVGLTVAEDIAFYLENTKTKPEIMHEKVDEVLKVLGITKIKSLEPNRLSGGEKQKVSLAGVLVNDVRCLLLDEPLANLDPQSTKEVMQLLKYLNEHLQISIIMVEHRLEDALSIDFDRMIVVNNGEIICDEKPSEVLKSSILTSIGIRKPLFLEALDRLDYNFEKIDNCLDFSEYKIDDLQIDNLQIEARKVKPEQLLELTNVSFSYKPEKIVLQDVNFSVNVGEIVALLGANGSGKSTLCNILSGINKGYNGTVKLLGQELTSGPYQRSSSIAYVMQNPNHTITETIVEDEVGFSLKLQNISDSDREERILEALEICNLSKYRTWPISMLSYGQRRRVTIAAALIKKPKLVLLDEPTAGQDYNTFKAIMDTIEKMRTKLGISTLIITHNMQLAYEYADRGLVLNEGKIIYDNTIEQLYMKDDILNKASLCPTSIQDFANYHQLSAHDLGQVLLKEEMNEH